ncbi:MAG TPA: hypothetical protein PLM07_04105 [Candidatus Rifleibacterium sp.]|nr:hypothetical protein [Candidatus Rifleibacterium sp.]HPT45068.1 hypothetical protein [Candidatus Rifleibacterium sp.]
MKFRSVKKYLNKKLRRLECQATDHVGCKTSCCFDCREVCGEVCKHAYEYRLSFTTSCRHLIARQALNHVRRLQKIRKERKP